MLSNGAGAPAYKINDTAFNKADIEPKLAEIFATRQEKVMFVKGDKDLDFARSPRLSTLVIRPESTISV